MRQLIEEVCGQQPFTSDPYTSRDHWRFERTGLLESAKLLKSERDLAESEVTYLRHRNTILEDDVRMLRSILADKDAEIVRLMVLLDGQSKRKH